MILVLENEVDLSERYLVDEIVRYLPEYEVYDYAQKGTKRQPDISNYDGVIVGGSTAGVYEEDEYPWMSQQKELIRELVEKEIPTLGICFGHQIINSALGGKVVNSGKRRAHLVRAELTDDDLFEGVEPVVPILHSDIVTRKGKRMEVIGKTDYYPYFATRHRDAPVWTVQYHPEFTPRVKHLGGGWEENELSFEDSTATNTLRNFYSISTGDKLGKLSAGNKRLRDDT